MENPNACDEETTTTVEYEYDEFADEGEGCFEVVYTQTNKNAPGTLARIVTVVFGEKIEQSRSLTDDAVCCVEINLGCFQEEDGEDQFDDGTCIEGPEGTLCETCDLSFYKTTNLYATSTAF